MSGETLKPVTLNFVRLKIFFEVTDCTWPLNCNINIIGNQVTGIHITCKQPPLLGVCTNTQASRIASLVLWWRCRRCYRTLKRRRRHWWSIDDVRKVISVPDPRTACECWPRWMIATSVQSHVRQVAPTTARAREGSAPPRRRRISSDVSGSWMIHGHLPTPPHHSRSTRKDRDARGEWRPACSPDHREQGRVSVRSGISPAHRARNAIPSTLRVLSDVAEDVFHVFFPLCVLWDPLQASSSALMVCNQKVFTFEFFTVFPNLCFYLIPWFPNRQLLLQHF